MSPSPFAAQPLAALAGSSTPAGWPRVAFVVWMIMLGMPLGMTLFFTHPGVAWVTYPLTIGVLVPGTIWQLARRQRVALPTPMKLWALLYLLEAACLGWTLTSSVSPA